MTTSLLVTSVPTAPTTPRLRRLSYEPERRTRTGRLAPPNGTSALPLDNPLPVARAAPAIRTTLLRTAARVPHPRGDGPPSSGRANSGRVSSGRGTRRTTVHPAASPEERAEAGRVVARHLRTALEVLDGHRPIAQLADLFTPPALRYWLAATRRHRGPGPARFVRMRLCSPRSGVAEVAVTVEIDGRPRAMAARFERQRNRWLCTAVRLG
jgi:hypothetical protein